MKTRILSVLFFFLLLVPFLSSGQAGISDSAGLAKIRNEAIINSQCMKLLTQLCDAWGPRLSWSQGFRAAADWVRGTLKDNGIDNITVETWLPKGRDWTVIDFHASMLEPYFLPLIAYPKPYTPRLQGTIRAHVELLELNPNTNLKDYKGSFKGKIVFLLPAQPIGLQTRPPVNRYADTTLTRMAAWQLPDSAAKAEEKAKETENEKQNVEYFTRIQEAITFCGREGALLVVEPGYKIYGTTQVWSAVSNEKLNSLFDYFTLASLANSEIVVPQVAVSVENYNSIVRTLKLNIPVTLEVTLDVREKQAREGFNVIAEIPGTDLKDEIVMMGAHLDSYSVAQGATDDATGVVACMEALRIIKKLGIQPRRTIRIGIWGGEEMDLLGSKAYVEKHFGKDSPEKCHAYFNMDFGVGRFRGIYAMENARAAEVFKKWMDWIGDPKFKTVTLQYTGNSDHVSFYDAHLPGFPFLQDQLDYYRIYHTNMDTWDRVPEADFRQDAFIMAAFAWFAANSNDSF